MTDIGTRIRRPVVILLILFNIVFATQSDLPTILKHHKNRIEEESSHTSHDDGLAGLSLYFQRTKNDTLIEENGGDDALEECSHLFTQQIKGTPFFFCSRRTVWEEHFRLTSCSLDTSERPKRILVILDHAIRSPESDHHFSYYYQKPRKCWECIHDPQKQSEKATAHKPNYICNHKTSDHYEEKLRPYFLGSETIVGKLCINLRQTESKYWEKDAICDRIQILIPNNDSSPCTYFPTFPEFPIYHPDPNPELKEKIELIKEHYHNGYFYIDVDPKTTDSDEEITNNHLQLIYNELVGKISSGAEASSSSSGSSWIFLTPAFMLSVLTKHFPVSFS